MKVAVTKQRVQLFLGTPFVANRSSSLVLIGILNILGGCAQIRDRDFVIDTIEALRSVRIDVDSFQLDITHDRLEFTESGNLTIGVKSYCTPSDDKKRGSEMEKMAQWRDALVETVRLLNRQRLHVRAFVFDHCGVCLSYHDGKLTRHNKSSSKTCPEYEHCDRELSTWVVPAP